MKNDLSGNWYWIAAIGFCGGTLGSLLGIGGGVLVVPALVLAMGVDQKVAQGTALAMMVPMAIMATIRYHLNPDIKLDWGVIAILAGCAVLGANLGSSIAERLSPQILQRSFGVFVVIAGVKMIWNSFK